MIYVLDTETTGLRGCPDDHVVDVGIASLDIESGKVEKVYSSVVGYNVNSWGPLHKNAWIFNNTDLTLEYVFSAPDQKEIAKELMEVLSGKDVTSYNTGFDFNRFLYNSPWGFRGIFNEMPDIMKAASYVCKLPGRYGDYKLPKLDFAYDKLCPGDPANIHGRQDHRALSDAVVASHVLKSLIDMKAYPEALVLS